MGDTAHLNSENQPSNYDIISFNEMDHDMIFSGWKADSGFYSLRQHADSSISAHVEARLIRGAPSQREEFLTDTIHFYIKGKFIAR